MVGDGRDVMQKRWDCGIALLYVLSVYMSLSSACVLHQVHHLVRLKQHCGVEEDCRMVTQIEIYNMHRLLHFCVCLERAFSMGSIPTRIKRSESHCTVEGCMYVEGRSQQTLGQRRGNVAAAPRPTTCWCFRHVNLDPAACTMLRTRQA